MLDYDRTERGWEVFDCVSAHTHFVFRFRWLARLVCAISDHTRA